MAVSALEPKFWIGFVAMLGLDDLAGSGFAMGEDAVAVVEEIEGVLATHDRGHWLGLAEDHGLPVSAVHSAVEAGRDSIFVDTGLVEALPMPGDEMVEGIGPWMPDIGRTPKRPAPALGEHTDTVLQKIRNLT